MVVFHKSLIRKMRLIVLVLVNTWFSACSHQIYTSQEHRTFNLAAHDLYQHGIAFTTPSSITGREQDRQSLALTFAEVLREKRPDIRVVTLPETLSAINKAGLLNEYMQMYENYEQTGIFDHTKLQKISALTRTRYIAQLNLSGFNQGEKNRFSFLGWRLLETKRANIRVFLQIWDSEAGGIAWEGYEEMNYATEHYTEQAITFYDITRQIAEHMVDRIPQRTVAGQSEAAPALSQSDDESTVPAPF